MAVLETQRLLLQQWGPGDWRRFKPVAQNPRVMKHIEHGKPWSDERIESFVNEQIEGMKKSGFCFWPLIYKENHELIGLCGLAPLEDTGEIEIGWWLLPEYWGKGLATEAAREVMKYGFETIGLKRIVAIAHPPNEESIRIMQKLGMEFEKMTLHLGEIEVVLYSRSNPDEASEST